MASVDPGARVVASPGCATPETLLAALGGRALEIGDITLSSGLLLGSYPFVAALEAGRLRYRTWHVMAPVRDQVRRGVVDYIPVRGSQVPAMMAGNVDVVLLRVTPPDRQGYCSLGPSASYSRAALTAAAVKIAEVDESLPRTWGDTAVHVSEFDHLVDAATPTCLYRSAPRSEPSDRIAASIVALLPFEATIQLGIGAIPEAVLAAVAEADIGPLRLVGLGSDGLVALWEGGVLERSPAAPAVTAVEMMGTRTLLDFAHDNPAVAMAASTTCHDPRWLATLPRLVSINSAVEVDLSGQVSSESVRGEVIAGIGGSLDFFEGAMGSPGGLRIIAMLSTTPDGSISKIVPDLAAGTPVTVPRHCVDLVITEHGVASLANKSIRERAEALIAIADPRHRDELVAAMKGGDRGSQR
jgi:4-hydroxybutyrate CoA-transferase